MSESIISTIIGGAIGDAIGVPVEFKERDTFKVTDMIGYGTHNQPAGTWSDDTSLTLCLIANLTEGGDLEDLMSKFSDWHKSGYMTPHGKCFDDGQTTFKAIAAFRKGTKAHECGQHKESDNGNGALMRIAPVVFLDIPESLFDNTYKYSTITHAHPRSILGCLIYTTYLRQLYLGKQKKEAFDAIVKICNENMHLENELPYYNRILSGEIWNLKREDIKSSGYVVHTLEAALWSFLKHSNFKNIVLEAVNLGGDTDTTGIVAGSMAGMFYGLKNIPKEWVSSLAKADEIKELCKKFAASLPKLSI